MRWRSSRYARLLAVAVVALLASLAWFHRERSRAPVTGNRSPDFTFSDLEGSEVRLASHRGRVVLVNLWATNCGPCVKEMPSMQRLFEAFEGRDFTILAISLDGTIGEVGPSGYLGGDVEEFARALGLTFPILLDPEGRSRRIFRITGIPESFLIGRDGIIYKKVTGAAEWDAPETLALIERLLDA